MLGVLQLKRPKILIPVLLLAIILVNLSLYKYNPSTTKRVDELWIQYSYKNVDQFRLSKVYTTGDLRHELATEFPYEKSTQVIPQNIWQMWKTDDVESLDKGLQDLIHTWQNQQNFTHKIVRNDRFVQFINETYGDKVPSIVEAFTKMPQIILQSDFIRYLLLFAYGGVYSDIDTSLNTNMTEWLSYKNTITPDLGNEIGLVIGIESDRDEKNWDRNGMARRLQFCQWTLQAKPGHPFYRELVYRIADLSLNHYDPVTKILTKNGKKYDFNPDSSTRFAGVMEWTGPGMFTDTFFDYLNEVYKTSERLNPELSFPRDKMIDPNRELDLLSKVKYQKLKGSWHNEYHPNSRPIGWQNITKLVKPILYDDDVLILPHAYFGGKKGEPLDYTQHHFKGSWKNEKN